MAFDAGILSYIVRELQKCIGGKIEKVQQPEKDEINLLIRADGQTRRLIINAGSNYPRICFTDAQKENPKAAPMFCMLLRKHLTGAKLISVLQPDFERSVELCFSGYDELGFVSNKYLIAEIMGTYSNIILTDGERKILGALRIIDFTASSKRQILPGMVYELPPKQNKINPLFETETTVSDRMKEAQDDMPAEKFFTSTYFGISKAVVRELVFRAAGRTDATVADCRDKLPKLTAAMITRMNNGEASPSMVVSDVDGKPLEYAYIDLLQYGISAKSYEFDTCSQLICAFYDTRANTERIKQRSSDIQRLLNNAETRIEKKLTLQSKELADCADGEKYKLYGDLLTANLYKCKRGESEVTVDNYYADPPESVKIPLDVRLTPSLNAQKHYKKYAKSKTAQKELTYRIELGRAELEYIRSVADALSRAQSEADIAEIRDELFRGGYASKMKGYTVKKPPQPKPLTFKTSGGYILKCGKNNIQNEYITFRLAEKSDWWFHAKGVPGSHVLMICNGKEPSERDFTEAATVAAVYSKNAGKPVADVDYTTVKNIKKPNGAHPGFVIYHTNWSATVKPDGELAKSLSVKI